MVFYLLSWVRKVINSCKLIKYNPDKAIDYINGKDDDSSKVLNLEGMMISYIIIRGILAEFSDLSIIKHFEISSFFKGPLFFIINKLSIYLVNGILGLWLIAYNVIWFVSLTYFYMKTFRDNETNLSLNKFFKWSFYFSMIFNILLSIGYLGYINIIKTLAAYNLISVHIDEYQLAIIYFAIPMANAYFISMLLLRHYFKCNILYLYGVYIISFLAIIVYIFTLFKRTRKYWIIIFDVLTYYVSVIMFSLSIIYFVAKQIYNYDEGLSFEIYLITPINILFIIFLLWIDKKWGNTKRRRKAM